MAAGCWYVMKVVKRESGVDEPVRSSATDTA